MTTVAEAPAAPDTVAAGAPTAEEVALEKATQWANDYAARLTERTMSRLAGTHSQPNGHPVPHIGEPTTGPYVAFDMAATSPIQVGGPPPYQPSKIIKAGESAFLVAWIYVNPTVDPASGWAVSAGVQLTGRTWRATLDQANLTIGGMLPQQVRTGVFPNPTPAITTVVFPLATPNPGADPWLIEANLTVDIVNPGLPYAAFVTNFFDVDNDPGFIFVPPTPPGWRHELPNRYLIYS